MGFFNYKGFIKSIRKLEKCEEVTIAYIYVIKSRNIRRKELKENLSFDCTCELGKEEVILFQFIYSCFI